MAFINEDAGCACRRSLHVCLWTVNTTLELYALNGVGGPSEGRRPVFFFPSRILADAKLVRSDLQRLGVDLFFSSFHHFLNIKNNFILILYC